MKKLISRLKVLLIITSAPFFIQNIYAASGSVAEAVIQKHDLNIGFRSYDLFTDVHEISNSNYRLALTKGTLANLNSRKLSGLIQQSPATITVNIPYNGSTIQVDLVSVNILTPDFTVRTSENKTIAYTPGKYYRGIIKNNPNSVAAFSFFDNEFYGVVSDDDNGNIVIGKTQHSGNKNEYIIYSDKHLTHNSSNFCSTSDNASDVKRLQQLTTPSSVSAVNCVKLYYEIDNDIYQNNNSNVINTTNWITAVHNSVGTLFFNDNIIVSLNSVFIWTTPDPYTGADADEQLALFQSTRASFSGDAGLLVAIDGNNGGKTALINSLCTTQNYSYVDVDFEFSALPTYSWTVEAITHEFGHQLGSHHTHWCGWAGGAIDNCGPAAGYPTEGGCPNGPAPINGGTIMSYCQLTLDGINFNKGFGPMPRTAIQTAISAAVCLGTSCVMCPASSNNECSSPVSIVINTNCIYTAGTLCGATQSMPPLNCTGRQAVNANDNWFSFVPLQNAIVINCKPSANTDLVISLYTGACGSLSLVACSDSTANGGIERIFASVSPGLPYYLRIYDFNGKTTGTDFGICVTQACVPATNDDCLGSTSLNISTSCNFLNGELCSATQTLPPETCSGFISSEAYDLFYKIVPTQSDVRITCKSGLTTDMVMLLYEGTCNNLSLMACSDTTTAGGTETLEAVLNPGSTYYIRVYDWDGNDDGTDFKICVQYIACSTPEDPSSADADVDPICAGSSSILTVSGTLTPGATWTWYSSSCGGTPAGTGESISVFPITETTYYVRAERASCFSNCSSVTVSVNPNPTAPSSANATPSSVCTGGTSQLAVTGTLSAGATWHWYSGSCSGTPVGTGTPLTVTPSGSTSYFVRAENGDCSSSCVNANVTLTATPFDPVTVTGTTPICTGASTNLQVTGTLTPGASWHWYTNSCGGTAVGTGASLSISPSSTTTYYVRAENNSCYSNCKSVTITVSLAPASPTTATATPVSLCSGGLSSTLNLTGTLSAGATWHWYSGTCGGTPVGTGASVSVTPSTTTSYYVRAENGNCFSTCANTSVSVSTTPANPVSASGTSPICSGTSTAIQVTGSLSAGATWHWYSGTCGGTAVGTGASVNVSPTSNTTYFVRAENNLCYSTCSSVTINVNQSPAAPTTAAANPLFLCSAGASSTLSLTGTLSPGATWHWYSGTCGGTPVGTGVSVSVTPASTTSYFVRAENGTCSSACSTAVVNVASIPSNPVSATSTSPICSGTNSSLHVNGALTGGAAWHWYSGTCGGTPVDTGATISVSPTINTTYFVRAENGTCYSNCTTVAVVVNPSPAAPTSVDASPMQLCSAGSSTLSVSGTLSAGATWHWYSGTCGGTPVGTGASVPVNVASTTNYYVRAEDGNCSSACLNIQITISAVPNAPDSAAGVSPVCEGSNSPLHVSGTLSTDATWNWYADSCAGTSLGSGSTINVFPFVTTTYYVRAENGACHSSCVSTTINVNPSPTNPDPISFSSDNICIGNSVLLWETAVLSPGSDWFWFIDSCRGNPVGTGDSILVTPIDDVTYFIRSEDSICPSTCQSISINVNPLPLQPVIVVNHDTLSVSSYTTYQWYWSLDRTIFSVVGNNQQQVVSIDGYYFVIVTDVNGCTAFSDTILYQKPDYILEKNISAFISIYPNPVTDLININFKTALNENAKLKIYDMTGRVVYTCQVLDGKTNVISLSSFAPGIYQFLFSIDDKIFGRKVLKQ